MKRPVLKHSGHLRTLEKCRKHLPAARVFLSSCQMPVVFYHSLKFNLRSLSKIRTRHWLKLITRVPVTKRHQSDRVRYYNNA